METLAEDAPHAEHLTLTDDVETAVRAIEAYAAARQE
jgi:hypothetical protein